MNNTIERMFFCILVVIAGLSVTRAQEVSKLDLPFDRERINRYSLDHLPRSISIRQGEDVWLGYDLQRAKLYKMWRAPQGDSGFKPSGFVMRSSGETLFEDKTETTWKLQRGDETSAPSIRYLGCSQRDGHFELRWELADDTDVMTLRERIAMMSQDRALREIQVESLPVGSQLLPPPSVQKGWTLATVEGKPVLNLTDVQWHRLTPR